jgi:uncharacterized protein (TIGR04255 family)
VSSATDALDLIRGEPVEEVPLDPTPLARVVAQARFEQMGVFQLDSPIKGLIRPMIELGYPLYEEGFEKEIMVGPSGVVQNDSTTPIWRFKAVDQTWIVTVTPASIALETTAYDSRPNFVDRFMQATSAFTAEIGQSAINRLGVRYTNLVSSATSEGVVDFFDRTVRGPINLSNSGQGLRHGLNDAAIFDGPQGLQGKWGILPAGALYDPTLPPTQAPSGLLDIDSFKEASLSMTPDAVRAELNILAEAAYRLFRQVVSADFIDARRAVSL